MTTTIPKWPHDEVAASSTLTESRATRVRFHELLMSGGVMTGYGPDSRMTYSGPVDPSEHITCPWHGDDCGAWIAIRGGYGTAATLEALMEQLSEAAAEGDEEAQIDLKGQIEALLPKPGAMTLSEIRSLEFAEARAARLLSLADTAPANQEDRWAKTKPVSRQPEQAKGGYAWDRKPRIEDARDTAEREVATLGEEIPDEIIIEGDEDE